MFAFHFEIAHARRQSKSPSSCQEFWTVADLSCEGNDVLLNHPYYCSAKSKALAIWTGKFLMIWNRHTVNLMGTEGLGLEVCDPIAWWKSILICLLVRVFTSHFQHRCSFLENRKPLYLLNRWCTNIERMWALFMFDWSAFVMVWSILPEAHSSLPAGFAELCTVFSVWL